MPEREAIERAQEDAREGKHGASSPQQAIAIGLSKARRAGVKLPAPKGSASTRKKAAQDTKAGKHPGRKTSTRRSRATLGALKRESRSSATWQALSKQARQSAAKRGPRARSAAAVKAARTRKAA